MLFVSYGYYYYSYSIDVQFCQLFLISTREDWSAAPCSWVKVVVVHVERESIPLTLPLIAAEQAEEFGDVINQTIVVIYHFPLDGLVYLHGHIPILNHVPLNHVEQPVRHQIILIGLFGFGGT